MEEKETIRIQIDLDKGVREDLKKTAEKGKRKLKPYLEMVLTEHRDKIISSDLLHKTN